MKTPSSRLSILEVDLSGAVLDAGGLDAHLSDFDLELFDLGAADSQTSLHLASCARCRSVVKEFEEERRRLLERKPPADVIQEVASKVVPWPNRAVHRARHWSALAAAAFVALSVLWLSLIPGRSEDTDSLLVASAGDALRRVVVPEKGGLTPKGTIAPLSVIRLRAGAQSVIERTVSVVPGDLLRVRFYREAEGHVLGGVVTDDGEWSELFSGHYAAGIHVPLATLRVTGDPGGGLVLVGDAKAVERERKLGEPQAGVDRVQIEWTPGRASRAAQQ